MNQPILSLIITMKTLLGFQSSDPDPPPSVPDQMSMTEQDGHHHLHEELQKQLDLDKSEEDEKGSNVSLAGEGEDEEFKSGQRDGEDVRNGEVDYQNDAANGNESEKIEGDEVEKKNETSYASNGIRSYQCPVRPEAEDCAFYMKTGSCKFGSNCKFNHPIRRKNQTAKEKVKEKEEETESPGQTECKYYLRTGGCKYGRACRFNHSRAKTSAIPGKTHVVPILKLNFLGLPIRPGEKECPYYMRNGSCKFAINCKFNHPDPTAAGGSDPPLAFANGGSGPAHGSSQSSAASWSSPGTLNESSAASWSSPVTLNEPPAFVPMMFSPTQGVPTQSHEWNGYQASIYPPERTVPPPPAYIINNPVTQTNLFAHQPQQMAVDEFPERPGQQECSYFMKTGDCKYKSNCKYHHPKNRISKTALCPLSDKGLPLRPDQSVCSHYSRYGICKFGPACKFHHPEQPQLSAESGSDQMARYNDDQMVRYGDSMIKEEARMAENKNEWDVAVEQPL